ncbi:RHS repeat-associated core domain-containing protein [Pseudomonas sp. NPDC007930]|uniref:RHS repeat-associated core domain-containing protein n=1 Tax=Pseudomonas sp. NPDC007930 TaxID=3364417 RepID=UPI0036E5E319
MYSARGYRALLWAADNTCSPLADGAHRRAYAPFGDCPGQAQLGFNGQWRAGAAGLYLLGNGHRAYHPRLGRFLQADALSPFGCGGLNSYAYCRADPINRIDPSGAVDALALAGLLSNVVSVLYRGLNIASRSVKTTPAASRYGLLAGMFGTAAGAAATIGSAQAEPPAWVAPFKWMALGLATLGYGLQVPEVLGRVRQVPARKMATRLGQTLAGPILMLKPRRTVYPGWLKP